MDINTFKNTLETKGRAPFLFLGSGFSRHYIDVPTWENLLKRFSPKPINQYYSLLGTKELPIIASHIAEDTIKEFWSLPEDDPWKQKHIEDADTTSSVLKYKISEYINNLSKAPFPKHYEDEVALLQSLCIDGIITTNWDTLAERIFPDYKPFIGQKQLLFSSTYGIAEIYKIHGSCTSPKSLVLTEEDYNDFNSRNAILAAKLITIFVEHPIVFLGYSISDPNIIDLLSNIVRCMDKEDLNKFKDNLVFVDWQEDCKTIFNIENTIITLQDGISLPVTRIETNSYYEVYKCFTGFKRKIPSNFLREFKKQFYDIALSEKPEKKLYALPGTNIEDFSNLEIVVGFGTISMCKESTKSYSSYSPDNILTDIFDDAGYNAEQILTITLPELHKKTPGAFFPIYKYLRQVGISTNEQYLSSKYNKGIEARSLASLQAYKNFSNEDKQLSVSQAIEKFKGDDVWRAIYLIPWLNIEPNDLDTLQIFIKQYYPIFKNDKKCKSYMRKLVCFYDLKKYGW